MDGNRRVGNHLADLADDPGRVDRFSMADPIRHSRERDFDSPVRAVPAVQKYYKQ